MPNCRRSTLGAKKVTEQFQAVTALANTFVVNSDQAVAASALARLKFVENSLKAISSTNEKIVQGLKEAVGNARGLSAGAGQADREFQEDRRADAEMTESAAAIMKGASAMKADLVSDQQRLEAESDATIGETEHLILMLAVGGFLLGCVLGAAARHGHFPADDRDVQGDARTRRRQFRRRAAGPRPQGRTRRDGGRGRGVQGAGHRQGRARCRRPGSAEQGERAPRAAPS